MILYRILVFLTCLSVSLVHAGSDAWAQFTSIEEEILSKIFEINTGIGCRDDFIYLQQTAVSNQVERMLQSLDSEDIDGLRKLAAALKADTRLAIDMTLIFIESKGAVNHKTERLFNQWSRATARLYWAMGDVLPEVKAERLGHLLEVRSGELYYMARSIGAYYGKQTEKNYAAVELHAELAFQYAQELDQLIDATLHEQEFEQEDENDPMEYVKPTDEVENERSSLECGAMHRL